MAKLFVQRPEGRGEQFDLQGLRVTVGRSRENDYFFPDDIRLSRKHFALARRPEGWEVRDLGSRNGTWVNGERVERDRSLATGDQIAAGSLIFRYEMAPQADASGTDVEFFSEPAPSQTMANTTVTRLRDLLQSQDPGGASPAATDATANPFEHPAFQALIQAGRELAGQSSLQELFETILSLSINAVAAERGVVMTLEGEDLNARATHGEGFRISTTVREKVIGNRASLLLRDTRLDEAIAKAQSIDLSATRSLLAVPLQTEQDVLGLIYLDTSSLTRPFTKDDLNLMTVLANVAATRIQRAQMEEVAKYQQLLEQDLQRAASIQEGLLPEHAPEVPGLDLAARTVPCRTVGGDYHDFFEKQDGGLAFVVGDVSGKGIPASLVMTGLQARMHVLEEDALDPAALSAKLNRSLCATTPDNCFVTFLYARIDPERRQVTWCNAGHNPALLLRKDGTHTLLDACGPVLGILPEVGYEVRTASLGSDEILLCYSDGVTEAANAEDEEFGEGRLIEAVQTMNDRPAEEILEGIVSSVREWSGSDEFADDLTIIVAKVV